MTSVLIKGMEKPKRCADCPIYFAGLCSVRLQNGKCPLDGTPEWCPMVDVPTPHGRLIDADRLDAEMYHEAFETDSEMQKWDSGCWIRYKMFENHMREAPTVIKAEVE